MRVLHFFKTYLPDNFAGVERVIWNIAESTHSLGVTTNVLSLSAYPSQTPVAHGHHTVHHAKQNLYVASTGLSVSVFRKFSELAKQSDIIHYHFPWPMMDLVHLVTSPTKPSVVTYHSDIVKQAQLSKFYRPLMQRFLGSVDKIVATSPEYLRTSPVLKTFRGKTCVIPIGIGEDRPLVRAEVQDAWRQRVGSGFFLFVGAPRYYKGLDYLVEAARRTGLPIVIAGVHPDELPSAASLPNVKVVGNVDDESKEALLSLCNSLVLPSHQRSEAFGVVLAEASRAGRPMITCEIGTGTSYVNLNGKTGIVVPPANAEALGSAMSLLSLDSELHQLMGQNSLRRFHQQFTAAAMGRSYASLYSKLINS